MVRARSGVAPELDTIPLTGWSVVGGSGRGQLKATQWNRLYSIVMITLKFEFKIIIRVLGIA